MTLSLNCLRPGQSAEVVELRSTDPARLDRLSGFGVTPGSVIRLAQLSPALIFCVGETEISVDWEVANEIIVELATTR